MTIMVYITVPCILFYIMTGYRNYILIKLFQQYSITSRAAIWAIPYLLSTGKYNILFMLEYSHINITCCKHSSINRNLFKVSDSHYTPTCISLKSKIAHTICTFFFH